MPAVGARQPLTRSATRVVSLVSQPYSKEDNPSNKFYLIKKLQLTLRTYVQNMKLDMMEITKMINL